ncbi:hypothetical protein QFC22_003789 [Naganishia vaughanmartiniae]|uniref:Uncharacterized protein n=1 Tax=Naganishia vaughanmartiniae TaxID=1424756 RepID=A0ACC2X3E8_9TREE|nr:hypothetical protein QFC22_003789 [Naganishia vaughanmartiniae]
MPDWSYPRTNAQAGPSNPAANRNRSRANPDITYTHWSQQHLETNPNAGFELLQGLMQMSGSHDPPPLLPRTTFRSNSTEEISTESTLSVLSNSTRNTDYTLGTPYSIMSNSSSSAYPVSNNVPDIPLTSWMLQPETNTTNKQQQQHVIGMNTHQNGTIGGSSYQGSLSSHTNQSLSLYSNAMFGSSAQGVSQQSSYQQNDSYASQQNPDGFRVPFSQPSAHSVHIRRDGHLPASLNYESDYGVEEGEIVDPAQFVDPRDMSLQIQKRTIEDELWGPSRTKTPSNFQARSSGQIQAHVQLHALTNGNRDSARSRAKGKEKDISVQYHTDLSTEDAAWLGNTDGQDEYSQESGSDDEDAMAQDGYMRNCEPMVRSEKRTFKSTKLLGSVLSRATSESHFDETNQKTRHALRQSNLEHSPQSTTSSTPLRGSHNLVTSDGEDDDTTSSPCRPGERQRFAYVNIPPWNYKDPTRKALYIHMDLPPLPLNPQKPVRKAAITARTLVGLAKAKDPTVEDEIEEEHTESEEEDERGEDVAELVIEGDKFLTRDDDGDASKDTCHQCRESNRDAKMLCGNADTNCDLKYCKECVEERYALIDLLASVAKRPPTDMSKLRHRYDFRFQADSRLFICPVCQGYCNCAPCLEKSKLIEKLHLAEIMCGSREEFERILNKYKNVQRFLEAMGAAKAPPVPRTIIHGIRLVSKAEDKKSLPIPQDVYLDLTKPERMEVTYRSMISLAGPVTWAFPKKSKKTKHGKKRKNPNETYEKDGADEESESDFVERAQRKKARSTKKRHKPPVVAPPRNSTMSSMPVIPFEFALDGQGAILFGDDGCPVINPVASSHTSPPKRKQVTFSQNLDAYDIRADGQSIAGLQFEPQPQQLSAEATRRAVKFIQHQLQQQQQQRDDPENHADFQLDPILQAFFSQQNDVDESVTLASAAALLPMGDATIEEQQHFANNLAEVGALIDVPQGPTSHTEPMPLDGQEIALNNDQSVPAEHRRADLDPLNNSPNMDIQTFDTVVAQVQQFQNVSPDPNELDAIFDFQAFSMPSDAEERQYDSAIDDGSKCTGSERGLTLDESFTEVKEGEI